jgi:D-alanine transaminase
MQDITQVYLNGEFLAPEAAQISAFDRGFIFGDGVYEVIPVFGHEPFRLPHHLQRLAHSLEAVHINNPLSGSEWSTMIHSLIETCSAEDQSVYLQVTRGPAPRDHAFPGEARPTVFAYSKPLKTPGVQELNQGVQAIVADDIRWDRCDIKAIALLANVILRQQAVEQGAAETILIHDGELTEGAASNIFVVIDGTLVTPPKSRQILPGITRDLVVELAGQHGVPYEERSVRREELFAADEVWMSSSMKEILPIVRIDDHVVGAGKPGPLFHHCYALYQDYKAAFRAGEVA